MHSKQISLEPVDSAHQPEGPEDRTEASPKDRGWYASQPGGPVHSKQISPAPVDSAHQPGGPEDRTEAGPKDRGWYASQPGGLRENSRG